MSPPRLHLTLSVVTILGFAMCCRSLATLPLSSPSSGTLTAPVRMDLMANGKTIGFVTIPAGTKVMIVQVAEDGYLAKRSATDSPFKVPKESLDPDDAATMPTQAPAVPTQTPTPAPSAAPTAAAIPMPSETPSSHASSASAGPTNAPTTDQVNKALGIPLFGEGSLWQESDAMVASRIEWPQESKTSW